MVGLEITDGKSCVIINLQLLPYCPKYFHMCLNETFGDFKVTGYVKPMFSWSKCSLVITNFLVRSPLDIPNTVQLSCVTALKLSRILKSKHVYAYIVALHGMHAFHMRVCPVVCEQCFVQFDPVEIPARVEEVDNI